MQGISEQWGEWVRSKMRERGGERRQTMGVQWTVVRILTSGGVGGLLGSSEQKGTMICL